MTSYPPPPPPYQPQPNQISPGYVPAYGQPYGQPYGQQPLQQQPGNVVVITQQSGVPRGVGNCPHCGIGIMRTNYTLIGLIILLLFFPVGIICCLMMTERVCSHCGAKH